MPTHSGHPLQGGIVIPVKDNGKCTHDTLHEAIAVCVDLPTAIDCCVNKVHY